MPKGHWSDCSLHNGPAMRPKWCDCGGYRKKPTFMGNLAAWLRMNIMYATRKITMRLVYRMLILAGHGLLKAAGAR